MEALTQQQLAARRTQHRDSERGELELKLALPSAADRFQCSQHLRERHTDKHSQANRTLARLHGKGCAFGTCGAEHRRSTYRRFVIFQHFRSLWRWAWRRCVKPYTLARWISVQLSARVCGQRLTKTYHMSRVVVGRTRLPALRQCWENHSVLIFGDVCVM